MSCYDANKSHVYSNLVHENLTSLFMLSKWIEPAISVLAFASTAQWTG